MIELHQYPSHVSRTYDLRSTWDSSCQFTLRKQTADSILPSFKDGAKSGGLRCTTAIKNGSLFFSVFILIHFFTNADWNEFFSCRIFGLFSVQRERRRNQPPWSRKINAGKITYPQNLLLGKGKQRARCVGWNLSRYLLGNWIVLYAAGKGLKYVIFFSLQFLSKQKLINSFPNNYFGNCVDEKHINLRFLVVSCKVKTQVYFNLK